MRPMLGKPCCRQRVWRSRSLSLGFGEKVYHGNSRLVDPFYGEWEIGTFYSAWRVIYEKSILCGSTDTCDSLDELDAKIKRIEFGRIESLKQPTAFDVCARFDTGITVEFLGTFSDGDESFHIFGPEKLHIMFSIPDGWLIGRSDPPFSKQPGHGKGVGPT